MVKSLERFFFGYRAVVLIVLGLFTVAMAIFASQLRMDAGFYKALPRDHPYIDTFFDYQDKLFGTNRIVVVLETTDGDIWSPGYLAELKKVSDDLGRFAAGGNAGVTSLWTPNTRVYEITEEGFAGRDLIPATVTPESIDAEAIAQIKKDVIEQRFVGYLVGKDFKSTILYAELREQDAKTGVALDYIDLGARLERDIRGVYEKGPYKVHIIGFATMISQIAESGLDYAPLFFAIAFLLTALAVYIYVRSWRLVALAVSCSLISVVWQLGLITILGYGLDPLAIIVPFLVFAIGVSHGVQQLSLFTREITKGSAPEAAARASFSGLFVPGLGALVTDIVGFAALYLIPIQMIQEVAITASIGVGLKIVSNLIMLPLLASLTQFTEKARRKAKAARSNRHRILRALGEVADPPVAWTVFALSIVVFAGAVFFGLDRQIGDLRPGAPELSPQARYNTDTAFVVSKYDIGLDLLTVVVETPAQSCVSYPYLKQIDELSWAIENVPGVRSVMSAASVIKQMNAGSSEGQLKFQVLPRNKDSLSLAITPIPTSVGLFDYNCTILPLYVFLTDSKSETLQRVTGAIKAWRMTQGVPPALGQDGVRDLGLATSTKDLCWSERDQRDGSWLLTPEDLTALTYTPQPVGDEDNRITLQGYQTSRERRQTILGLGLGTTVCPQTFAKPAGDAKPLWSLDVVVDAGSVGEPQALYLPEAMAKAGVAVGTANEIVVSGVAPSFHVRLASGNSGVIAAVNEVVAEWEIPTLLVVYVMVIIVVYLSYFDWRATLCCLVPLTMSTFLGLWFMSAMGIGLKVSTLPVLVLSVGIGVDYAFYIYNRLEYHLALGKDTPHAFRRAMFETGMAVVFTAVTLSIGVATWAFSPLKFQADMGLLLAFMFLINMIMAITVLPAWALALDRIVPPRAPETNEKAA